MKSRIKKILGAILVATCLVTPLTVLNNTVAVQASDRSSGTVKCYEGLNVRTGASTSYPKISGKYSSLPKGTTIYWDDRDGNWIHITYPTTGWIYAGPKNCNIYVFNYND